MYNLKQIKLQELIEQFEYYSSSYNGQNCINEEEFNDIFGCVLNDTE